MTTLPDLLRLLAVPVFGWIAIRDYRTRRVPARVWYPLLVLGVLALALEAAVKTGNPDAFRLFFLRVGLGIGLLVPLAFAFWWLGGFGRADAKAFAAVAVLFPTYPEFAVGGVSFPLFVPAIGLFSFSIIADAVLAGALYPLALAGRNALAGRFSKAMLVGIPTRTDDLLSKHGTLLETLDGFSLSGLDLDALRMYLRWRGLALADLRKRPDVFRSPATLPEEPNPPTGGAVDPEADPDPGGAPAASFDDNDTDDPWGAETFLDDIGGSAYGTTPEDLRAGLDLLAERETVWVSPGVPFLVPLFGGILLAYVFGDVLFYLLSLFGLV